MVALVNFSHPLSQHARDMIRAYHCGGTDLVVHDVSVKLDLDQDLETQAESLFSEATAAAGGVQNIDIVVPPGFAPIAVLIERLFQEEEYVPHILVLVSGGETPPLFLPRHFIRSSGGKTATPV